MNRHEDIVCKGCGKESFTGRCYHCLSCRDFDLCADCYDLDFTTAEHPFDHPVVCVFTVADVELYFGGEYISSDPPQSYRCPYCKEWGFNESTFLEHVSAMHPNASPLLVATMVTLFEQQQAARLFLEDEQLASIAATARSRNQQMRRTVGSLDLYLEQLNPDGSYRRASENEVPTISRGNEVVARDRVYRVSRRGGATPGRSSTSGRIFGTRLAATVTRSSVRNSNNNNSSNNNSSNNNNNSSSNGSNNSNALELEDDVFPIANNPRLNWLQRSPAAVERLRLSLTDTGHTLPPVEMQGDTAAPITHPALTEMMRFYGGNLQIPQDSPRPPGVRLFNPNSTNSPQPVNSSNGNQRNVYGPTSSFGSAPRNFFLGPDIFPREERRRTARMPSGGLPRLGPVSRALTTRNVDFSEAPVEETILNISSVEILMRSLNDEHAAVVKQREQERKRFLCYRFLSPKTPKRPKDNSLALRAEFVAHLLSSALCEEDFQGISFAATGIMNPKPKTVSNGGIAGAGDAEKISSP
ncbi:myosin-G heavy chain [Drosophila ficusphila]|uniref:myosin-G heavy chain n=1 Tax=Drosophila ficusphila TaxID=30025 RepID=UPI0007E72406|nr:myosin-G heavy chain [Drosophila ficusphila]